MTGLGKKFSNIQVQSSTNTAQSDYVYEDQNLPEEKAFLANGGLLDNPENMIQNTQVGYQQNNAGSWINNDNLLESATLLPNNERDDLYQDLFPSDFNHPPAITRQTNHSQNQPFQDDFNSFFMNDSSNAGLKMQDRQPDAIAPNLFDF